MKVALNTIVMPPNSKIGVGVYVDNLLDNLIELYPHHTFYGFVNRNQPAYKCDSPNYYPVEFSAEPQPSPALALWQLNFSRACSNLGIDIYQLPNTAPLFSFKCPTIANIHDLQEFKIQKYRPLRKIYRQFANWSMVRNCNLVLTLSQSSKQDIVNILGVDANRVCAIYLAHSPHFELKDKLGAVQTVKQKFNIEDYIVTVGDISPGKNLVNLVRMYAKLRLQGESRKLLLVGKERFPYKELHDIIFQLGLIDSVQFTGYVSLDDLISIYNAATVCVYPSLYEGFGLPVLEAMACGTPVVTSNVSSIPEVAGDAAVLFDPYSIDDMVVKVKSVLDSATYRQQLMERGLKRSRLFSWKQTAQETMMAYESVLERRRFNHK